MASVAEEREQYQGVGHAEWLTQNPSWPEPLAPEAFQGLAGAFTKTIEPHTEADPAGILIQFLTAFGNVVGSNPYFEVEGDRHRMKLNIVSVGETSKARKGTSWGRVKRAYQQVDPVWSKHRIMEGLSSGEGLIWAVRDPIASGEKGGDPGVTDKRLMVVEGEFTQVLRTMGRAGNTLSPVIRRAWDDGDLQILTKNSPATATRGHISISGHITMEDLQRDLSRTDAANGFGNRFLWVCVRRSKALPEGGNLRDSDLAPLIERLTRSVNFASGAGRMSWDPESLDVWREVYEELSEGKPGLLGAITSRSEAQTLRLACVYALLDGTTGIRREHLLAALAVWDFCEASAKYIFGDSTGDPTADKIVEALKGSRDGLTRTEIRDLFKRNKGEQEIGQALEALRRKGRVSCEKIETGGRAAERWSFRGNGTTTETTKTTEGGPA